MTPAPGVSRRRVALLFFGSFVAVAAVMRNLPVFYDADAYYHLAVARLYVTHGFTNSLEWARFSVLRDGFGDKDFLFHVFLMPFVARGDPHLGGVLALAALVALNVTVVGWLAARAMGSWGLAIGPLLLLTATDFSLRMIRLRPELLSLALLLLAIRCAASGRWVTLAVVSGLYALSHTGFHMVLVLIVGFALYEAVTTGRVAWRAAAWCALGIAAGLLVHPGFPSNVRIWFVQNVTFFTQNASLDFGPEILPHTTREVLLLNAGWWVTLALLWRSAVTVEPAANDARAAAFFTLSAVVFGLLYMLMARFVTYAVPLVTLALVLHVRSSGRSFAPRIRIGRSTVPVLAGVGLAVLCGCASTWSGWEKVRASLGRLLRANVREDFTAFRDALPDGARVFAPWAATEEFVFWAPQARYVNVLDPIFMIAKDADLYRAYVDVLEGREPDVPLAVKTRFDSDYFADDGQYPIPRARLAQDPRAQLVHDGVSYLYRVLPQRNADFLLDWKIVPPGTAVASLPAAIDGLPAYPRHATAAEREVEGYVDGARVPGAAGCVTLARAEAVDEQSTLEVSPYGAAELYVDGELKAGIPPRSALLGRGVFVPMALAAGRHVLAIRTCPYEGRTGFYALRRALAAPDPG